MSRLIVKGLPPYVSDARLREHFAQKGSVTDVKLMRRPDGTSRRFGFVGFRTEDEARAALEYFDRTYLDTARLSVGFAKRVGDESLVKQKKRPEAPPPPKAEKAPKSGASFDEFLAVMAPTLKRKEPAPAPVEAQNTPKAPKKARKPSTEPEPELEPAPSDGAAQNEELSDLEYMRRRMRHKVAGDAPPAFEQSDEDEEDEEDEEEDADAAAHRARLAEEEHRDEENVDTIMQSGRLFVRNLPFSATEDELESFFGAYGPVAQVRCVRQSVMTHSDRDSRALLRRKHWDSLDTETAANTNTGSHPARRIDQGLEGPRIRALRGSESRARCVPCA